MNKINGHFKNLVLAIFVASFSLSCDTNITRTTESTKAVGQPQPQAPISYGELVIKEQSDYLMIPVNATVSDQEQDTLSKISRSYEGDYDKRNYPLSNIIFYRKQDGETHLLLNKKAIITTFELIEPKTAAKTPTRVWLYQIVDQDTNKDQKFTSEDAVIGYMSDLSGKNLQQVTPNNTKILNWVVVPSQNSIFIKIIKDSNNDNKFTQADKTNFVRVNLEQPNLGTEIISEQIEKQIQSHIVK
ncbi:hypothetical protein [Nostoc sp. TCL26-01]|uniref:hypothetical protein n=1 Tax=Nostoc sp. TCL26-01 TaxID=2576904 RepID=UPI0015BD1DE3|nr:hypothetical protein [Nostoc sp. TCL26-01]QLE57336.1 hypothetical protein FD725_18505 [Nostoc sp. TCL26-01]